jgi:outer membrane protein assembly factor BamB
MIYGGTGGFVFAFDPSSGNEIWRCKLETGGFFNAARCGDVAVILQDNILIASCNGHIWGIDPKTGEQIWHNGLAGLGLGFVSLCNASTSLQYIHVVTKSNT